MPPEDFVQKVVSPTEPASEGLLTAKSGETVLTGTTEVKTGDEPVSPVAAARMAAWSRPVEDPGVKVEGPADPKRDGGVQTAQTLDLNTPALFERVNAAPQVKDATRTTDQTLVVPEQVDPAWGKLLQNANIDRSRSNGTDNADDPKKGQELPERKAEDLRQIQVRIVHRDANGNKVDQNGNPVTDDANYVIGKDGKIEELIPPNKKAYGDGDDRMVVEIDASETNAVNAANAIQKASAAALIAEIQAAAHNAGVAPDIPADLYAALNPAPAPPPRTVVRNTGGGGDAPAGGGYSGGNGGNGGGMGGGFDRGGGAGRAPQRQQRDVAGAEQARPVDTSKFDFQNLKVPDSLKPAVEKIVGIVSKHEGKPTSINWNDNGYGISVGMFQANQKAGELPMLLKKMHDDDPAKFDAIFGKHSKDMLNESFVRNTPITKGSELGNMMQRALNEPTFQQTQLNMIGEKVVKCAAILKEKTGITSEAGVMLFTDAVNQLGTAGASKYLRQGMSFEQMDASLRSGSSWRAQRNPGVVKDIQTAGLSKQQGSFDVQNA